MIVVLLYFIALAVLGFIVGVGALIHKETPWFQKFLSGHPVLGWTATFVAGGLAWLLAAYAISYAVVILLMLLGGHSNTITIPQQ